jgi:hypothetical protein
MLAHAKTATGRLESATAALADTNRRISETVEKRNAALLKDHDQEAIRLGGEIDALHQTAKAHEDKIRLLRAAAAEEERERKAREREGLINRIEVKLQLRDRHGAELATAVAAADKAFRKLIDVGVEIQAAWPWQASDIPACLLSHTAITHALTAELYKVGGRPMLGGGQVEGKHAGIHFPGARCPRHELVHMPEKISPLPDVLKQASEFASAIMRGKVPSAPDAIAVPVTNGGENVQRTQAQQRLSDLLVKQSTLAEDVSPQGEAAYRAHMELVRQAQDAVAAEQRTETQQNGR